MPQNQAANRWNLTIYLALSAVAGFFELGVVLYAIGQGWSLAALLLPPLGYQLGAFLPDLLAEHRRVISRVALIVSAIVLAAVAATPVTLALAMMFASAGLQMLRAESKAQCHASTALKRTFRILGFAVAPAFSPLSMVAVVSVSFGLGLRLSRGVDLRSLALPERPGWIHPSVAGAAMVVHQMHYFTYAFAIPVLLVRQFGMTEIQASMGFVLGWLSYISAPTLLGRLSPTAVVIAGHLSVAALLVGLGMSTPGGTTVLLGWFLTGFGGGTVYGIRALAKKRSGPEPPQMDFLENLGHVLGVVTAVTLTSVGLGWHALLIAGGLLAIGTACLVWVGSVPHIQSP